MFPKRPDQMKLLRETISGLILEEYEMVDVETINRLSQILLADEDSLSQGLQLAQSLSQIENWGDAPLLKGEGYPWMDVSWKTSYFIPTPQLHEALQKSAQKLGKNGNKITFHPISGGRTAVSISTYKTSMYRPGYGYKR